jgi:CheY-like chemotaxis protein
MTQVLLVDDDPGTLICFGAILRTAGYSVLTASSGSQGLEVFSQRLIDLAIIDLRLPDISGLDVVRTIRRQCPVIPVVVVTGFGSAREAVAVMRLGAADFVEKPIAEDDLLQTIKSALTSKEDNERSLRTPDNPEAHAAARWARYVVAIVESPKDPTTISRWASWVAASPGALRNWCRTAGFTPRRSLILGRMLRAVSLGEGGRHKPENLLDVVDRRTLASLLRFTGFEGEHDFPKDINEFLERQRLVRDLDALAELKRALADRRRGEPDKT